MRAISDGTIAFLKSGQPIDATFILEIQWATGGNSIQYSDRTIEGMDNLVPSIVSLGDMECSTTSDSAGQTNSLTVTLDDVDGSLKNIFNNTDIHKKTVNVYQFFISESAEKFLLFSGQILTPIIWSEGERTLTFDVVTKLEDQEVGFSADMGNYASIPYKFIGQAWPMVFGTVYHVPAMAIQEIPSAFTTEPFVIVDQSLIAEISKIGQEISATGAINFAKICSDFIWRDENCNQEEENKKAMDQGKQLQAEIDSLTLQQRDLQTKLTQQEMWQRSSVKLIPNMQITQPYHGLLKVGSGLFIGSIVAGGGTLNTTPQLEPGNYDITKQLIKAGYQFYNAGTQVSIAGNYPIDHIVSIVPGTVNAVYAYNSVRGLRTLVKVPEAWYTVSNKDFGCPLGPTLVVTLNQPLSVRSAMQNLGVQNWENNFGQYLQPHLVTQVDWEDDIYVSVTSSVGPNPVDIMIYIIQHYSNNTYDPDSFNHVHGLVAETPMNFMYQSLDSTMSFLTELAYQARCAIYLVEDVFHLKFLPEVGDVVDEITESDIDVGSMTIETTPTEDLITVYEATFRPDYTPTYSDPVRAIFRFNVNKYGYHQESHDFFAFNSFAVVRKVATFWMIRKSMTWKLLKCKLYLDKLKLEVFDTVNLNFARNWIANGAVSGMVISADYNPTDKMIDAIIWTPVRLGEMTAYGPTGFGGTESDIFPTYLDIQAGSAGGISGGEKMQLPAFNGVQLVVDLGNQATFSSGDKHPIAGGGYEDPIDDPSPAPDLFTPIPIDVPDLGDYAFPEKQDDTNDPNSAHGYCYPGRIEGYDKQEDGKQQYKVTMFPNGLLNASVSRAVVQLQIDTNDRIPEGTWVIISSNTFKGDVDDKGVQQYITERTMQVPVWLR